MALSDQSQNPLLGKWETQHEIAPFNVIYDEHFQPALEIACSDALLEVCLLYTSPSPRDRQKSRMPSSA